MFSLNKRKLSTHVASCKNVDTEHTSEMFTDNFTGTFNQKQSAFVA